MANYDIRPLQLRLLEILLAFQEICQARGLKYYLVDGTLIGAVRHKGFIPWDDDMDIAMPRPDYEQLIAHSNEWLPERYEFVCFENDPKYPLHFGKIQDRETTLIERPHLFYLGGVYVDVFPIDGAPEGRLRQKLYQAKYNYLRKMLYFCHRDPYRHGKGPSSWLPLLARKLRPMQAWQKLIKRQMMKYPFETSRLAAVNHNDGLGSMVSKENVLGAPTPVTFEGTTLWGMKDNHSYLTQLFGDYMTPPPMNKIHQHNFYYMDLNRPYREFDTSVLAFDTSVLAPSTTSVKPLKSRESVKSVTSANSEITSGDLTVLSAATSSSDAASSSSASDSASSSSASDSASSSSASDSASSSSASDSASSPSATDSDDPARASLTSSPLPSNAQANAQVVEIHAADFNGSTFEKSLSDDGTDPKKGRE